MRKTSRTLALAILALAAASSAQASTVLYNGSLGTAPQTQGWLEYTAVGSPTVTTTSTSTTLDTTSNQAILAGYSNYTPLGALVNSSFPTLSPTTGFTVYLNVQINSESHSSTNRGGFDWIVLGSDENGVELDFWQTDIWAQSGPTFTHAEDAAYNTTAAITSYALTISGSTYTLLANGSQILTGSTRNYSSFGTPYNLANYIFIGDDTNAADASETFTNLSVVPEPACGALCVGLITLVLTARKRDPS
jgi:hypothetical protein